MYKNLSLESFRALEPGSLEKNLKDILPGIFFHKDFTIREDRPCGIVVHYDHRLKRGERVDINGEAYYALTPARDDEVHGHGFTVVLTRNMFTND